MMTLRVGLVGYGLAGCAFHAPLIRACDRLELAAILTSRDAPNRVSSLDELLARCDLVVIASPNATHFPIAKKALEADRHVVVDKPFTVTAEEAETLIGLARERTRILTVFHNRRWDSDFLTLREIFPLLGEVSLFEAHWDRFRPAIKQGWREETAPGAGLLSDLGPHMIDQSLQLFGRPDSVEADIVAQREGAGVDDYFDVTLHYGTRRVCLRSSTLIAAPRPRFAVHGTGGSFVKHGLDPQEAQLRSGMDPRDPSFGVDANGGSLTLAKGRAEILHSRRGNYCAFYEAVADAILEGRPVPVPPEDALDGLMVIDLARSASKQGRLELPDASWTEG